MFDVELGRTWPLVIAVVISVMCILYLWTRLRSIGRAPSLNLEGVECFDVENAKKHPRVDGSGNTEEGFASSRSDEAYPRNQKDSEGFQNPGEIFQGVDQRLDDACYDAFYARVYDHLVQPLARAPIEVQTTIEFMKKRGREASMLRIADIGSGTGNHTELFAKAGVMSVTGYDKSAAMVEESRRRFSERDFVVGDATVATMAAADQFDVATLYYFTVYMVPERTQMLKNIYLWLAPGGVFVCHIVNKLKFDPVLEAASPFVGFSVQKYADERVTKSEIFFEELEYVGDFQLNGSRGAYVEDFQFKDGRVRRHEQRVWMPNIDVLVAEITAAGFKYAHHMDLTAIGYEYNYLFFFEK
jgi:SAM-dependent methyltransferase